MISPATTTTKTSPDSNSRTRTALPLKNNNNNFVARCPRATVVTCNSNTKSKQRQRQHSPRKACQEAWSCWNVQASRGSLLTSNPIREIIESINLAENPTKKVIPLSIGDPTIFGNLKPCKEILESLRNAESSGKFYGYQTAAGLEEARQAVANYHLKNAGNKLESRDVILTSGCSHAIDLCICVLAQAGQNILIPRPGFPLYKTLASVYGVEYKQYNLLAESNWSIDLEHLESLIDDKTAAIVINNPSNPCGSVYSKQHLLQILELAERYKKPIIADEIYDKFVFLPEHYAMHGFSYPPSSQSNEKLQQTDDFTINNDSITSSTTTTKAKIMRSASATTESLIKSSAARKSLCNNQPKSDGFWSSEDDEELEEDYDEDDEEEQYDEIMVDEDEDADGRDNDYNLIRQTTTSTIINKQNLPRLRHNDDNDHDNDGRDHDRDSFDTMSDLTTTSTDDQVPSDTPFIALSSLSKSVPILTCGGISKTCRIPGLRLGWIIVNDPIGAFEKSVRIGLNRLTQRLMGPNSLVQGALKEILDKVPESFYTSTMEFIFRNALLCYQRLGQMPGLEPYMPQGSMYLMVRFEPSAFPTIEGDLDFTSKLMNEESVLVLPGKCFEFPNYFRICLTVPTNIMEEALDRMSAFCERHHNARHNLTTPTNRNSNIKVFR